MGSTGSKAVKRISSIFSSGDDDSAGDQKTAVVRLNGATPYVLMRKGSMYIDEDGDMAHEFYEEDISNDKKKVTMRRITTNLRPQGFVRYEHPRLHTDIPVILCDM